MAKRKKKQQSKIEKNPYAYILGLLIIIIIIAIAFNFDKVMQMQLPSIGTQVIVTFGEETITQEELDQRYEFIFFISGYPEQYRQFMPPEAYLETLINEKLIVKSAEEQGITIKEEELDKAIEELAQLSKVTTTELEENLIENGFSMSYLRDYYEKQLVISKLINETIIKRIEVTDTEIREYYQENKENYEAGPGEIRARHILVETEKEAEEIYKELISTPILKQKTRFIELAKEKSTGPSSVNGGELNFFSRGQMVEEFEEAAFKLAVNKFSKPVKTEYGWHIILRDENKIYLSEAHELIEKTIMQEKQEQALKEYIDGLRSKIEIYKIEPIEEEEGCEENNLAAGTVIFYHTATCPYCKQMMPIVQELEQEGYEFYWADANTEEANIVNQCFSDVLQGGVPEFICAETKEYKMGAISKGTLKDFAEKCKA